MKLRPFVLAFIAFVIVPAIAFALTSQRAQIGITIVVNVTPNPLGYVHAPGATDTEIVAKATLHGASPALERAFEAQELHFLPVNSDAVVAQVQHSLRVEAEVTPNPTATLLTTDAPGSTVIENVEAGVVTKFSCVYHVTVDTTITNWQLKDGLSNDFSSGTATWPGTDLGKNTYVAAPNPTSTPFVVYADDGGAWSIVNGAYYSGTQTFCVDLTFNIPIATAQGTYSSNAIYTLYY
jgi:hypothetical protein